MKVWMNIQLYVHMCTYELIGGIIFYPRDPDAAKCDIHSIIHAYIYTYLHMNMDGDGDIDEDMHLYIL